MDKKARKKLAELAKPIGKERKAQLKADMRAMMAAVKKPRREQGEMVDTCSEIITRAIRWLDKSVELLNTEITNEALSRSGLLHICTEVDEQMYVAGKDPTSAMSSACRLMTDALSGYRYEVDDVENTAPVFLGVVGGNSSMMQKAHIVNFEKIALKALCGLIKGKRMRVQVKDGQGGYKLENKNLVRVILAHIQESDINLLAAWRTIPILKAQPKLIAFSATQSRAVYKKEKEEIKQMLDDSRDVRARDDLGIIRSMKDSHFALAMPRYPRYRANVKYVGLDKQNKGRTSLTVSLPILYSGERLKEAPNVKFPRDKAESSVRKRRASISEQPILASLPVHRYKERVNAG